MAAVLVRRGLTDPKRVCASILVHLRRHGRWNRTAVSQGRVRKRTLLRQVYPLGANPFGTEVPALSSIGKLEAVYITVRD